MAEEHNLILEYLRRIDARLTNMENDIRDLKTRVTNLEVQMANMDLKIAQLNARFDRIDDRITRIERRLEITSVPHLGLDDEGPYHKPQ